jgi:small subunit ribosomal protein S18
MNTKENKVRTCRFCVDKKLVIDYKDIGMLGRFISSYKKIAPRRRSGLCAKHQRQISTAIKRARQNALLPYVAR